MAETTADPIVALVKGPPTQTFVAVTNRIHWPSEGYGGPNLAASLNDAAAQQRRAAEGGYGFDSNGRLHIIRTTTEVWEVPEDVARAIRAEKKEGESA